MYRKFILLALSVLMVAGFFLLPQNSEWLGDRILPYWSDLQKQKNHLGLEERKVDRYGNSYTYSKFIDNFFEKKDLKKNALVLVPPTSYFAAHGLKYHVPEPAVFYYFTGLKTLWVNSPEATKANWYVRAAQGKIIIDSASSHLSDSIKAWLKYPVSL